MKNKLLSETIIEILKEHHTLKPYRYTNINQPSSYEYEYDEYGIRLYYYKGTHSFTCQCIELNYVKDERVYIYAPGHTPEPHTTIINGIAQYSGDTIKITDPNFTNKLLNIFNTVHEYCEQA